MVDISAISGALGALKAAKDIAESMIRAGNAAAFQAKMIEFQSRIIDANNAAFAAQEERSTLLERVRELEKEVASLEAWEAEKKRYELQSVWQTAFAYVLKKDASNSEPPHWLCATCYQNGKKSLLQAIPVLGQYYNNWCCTTCNEKLVVYSEFSPWHPWSPA